MKEGEREIGHEKIIDYDFRVSSVEGMGSGAGFQLKNLSLPKDYEDLIKALDPKINISDGLRRILEGDCRHFQLPQGVIEVKDNLLTQIVFGGLGYSSRLYLDSNHGYDQGIYRFENVEDVWMALVLAKTASSYMNFLERDDRYAYVDYAGDGFRNKYFSVGLKIPDDLAEKAKKLTMNFSGTNLQ